MAYPWHLVFIFHFVYEPESRIVQIFQISPLVPRGAQSGCVGAGGWIKPHDAPGICAVLQVGVEAEGPARMRLLCPEDVPCLTCVSQLGGPRPTWGGCL